MYNAELLRTSTKVWATDASKNGLKDPEIINTDVVDQSIELILTTVRGERLFNLTFGSRFSLLLFDNMSKDSLNTLVAECIADIQRWEDRVIILEKNVNLTVNYDEHMISLSIPYVIKANGQYGKFQKIIKE